MTLRSASISMKALTVVRAERDTTHMVIHTMYLEWHGIDRITGIEIMIGMEWKFSGTDQSGACIHSVGVLLVHG